MTSRPTHRPRKRPRQERAQATVDAILQATAYILVRQGWGALSTNRIATKAGVNIASLYQYFPNKEAIVAELQRRHVATARAAMPRGAEALAKLPTLEAVLEAIARAAIEEHRIAPALHRVFTEELPRSARLADAASDAVVDRFWRDVLSRFVRPGADLDVAIFVVRVSLHAVVHEAARERPELLDGDALCEPVVRMLSAFLARGAGKKVKR